MKRSTAFQLIGFITIALILFSCKQYKPTVKFTLRDTQVLIEDSVETMYINIGLAGCVTSIKAGADPYAVRIRFNSNIPGKYTCNQSNYNNSIEIFDGIDTYSTFSMAGSSGTIEVIQAGQNIVEGYFSATFQTNFGEVKINNGIFSGNAMGIASTCQ